MGEVVKLNLRMPLELREDVDAVAKALGVSANAFIIAAIKGRITWATKNLRADRYKRPDFGPDTGSTTAVLEGLARVRQEVPKVGANQLCPCGSGQKYKRCHGAM